VGTFVTYWSETRNDWIPATILAYNGDGTYNLDVKSNATVDKMRIRCGLDVLKSTTIPEESNEWKSPSKFSPAKGENNMYGGALGEVVGRLTNPFSQGNDHRRNE